MGTEIRFTSAPTRVTATTTQAAKDALDVLAYSAAELYLLVYEVSGASPVVIVTIETSMQNVSENSALWKTIATFTGITASNTIDTQSITSGILRYIRYKITLNGAITGATFELSGIARAG